MLSARRARVRGASRSRLVLAAGSASSRGRRRRSTYLSETFKLILPNIAEFDETDEEDEQTAQLSFLQVVNELHRKTEPSEGDKATNDAQAESPCRELQQGDGTGAKPPDACLNALKEREDSGREMSDSNITQDLDDDDDDDDDDDEDDDDDDDDDDEESSLDSEHNSLGGSLGLSTSSSLDSASELLLAAAAAVESGGSDGSAGGGSLCVTVRHLMRSIASIERLMDRVLRQCAQYAHKQTNNR
ncbi:unnamed protein product [Plutella xylostella]|uniref:(diamondback moth) hypothetical protein n=1 Tax=Plutella xylostella TaxID=51655 RepID=A0A8S4EX55_PLUXY|nr:unnamed protein product [Plutella xylostella]